MFKRTTVIHANEPNKDVAALESKERYPLSPFWQRRGCAPPCVAHSCGKGWAAALDGVVVKDDLVWN